MKKVCILGSTGSIGSNALEVIRHYGREFCIVGLSAKSNASLLLQQAREFKPRYIAIDEVDKVNDLKRELGEKIEVFGGSSGIVEMVEICDCDYVLSAMVGAAGLKPTMHAIKKGKRIMLANKEVLVMAGQIFIQEAQKHGVDIIPVDSEHSAIFQCIQGKDYSDIAGIILTASGGPFLRRKGDLNGVTIEEALNHPNWKMGKKITIDSATLMNKGLEFIEAYWLFGRDVEKLKVIIHPQSIVHSLVEYLDGSVLAQLGVADMKVPIQYALSYPTRLHRITEALDLVEVGALTFEEPDEDRFPSIRLAKAALLVGGTLPSVLNAANEIAVDRFLKGNIRFGEIHVLIEDVMGKHHAVKDPNLDDMIDSDQWAREAAIVWKQ